MKKVFAWLLLLVFLAGACAVVHAESKETVIRARDVSLNKHSNTIAVKLEDEKYYRIIDADGNVLMTEATGYTYMYSSGSYPFFEVEVKSSDGVHDEGLVDGWGNVLVPAEYADVNIISGRWQAGIKLTPSSADEKDYTFTFSNNEKKFFRIDTVDFYFDGRKVGSLNRSEYGGGNCTAYNSYLSVVNTARDRIYYNNKLERSPYTSTGSGEFDSIYKKGVYTYIHQGSGQTAFVPSCTLDPNDLSDPYLYDHGEVKDVQGNVLFRAAQVYDSVRDFKNGYALVRINRMYGLIDKQGNEVIPTLYDDLSNYEDNLLQFGYISAVKDGKFGFLDAHGNVTCPFVYANDVVRNRGTFATVKNLDGTTIVLSAAVGELPEHFADTEFPTSYGCRAFVGKNAQGQYCVADLYGNTLLPYQDYYRSIYLSVDGSVGVVSYGSWEYGIFHFDIADAAAPAADAPAVSAVDDGSWTCENGHGGNTGKFCTECGSPKPVVETRVTECPNCGYAFGDTTPKFCPECGTKIEK